MKINEYLGFRSGGLSAEQDFARGWRALIYPLGNGASQRRRRKKEEIKKKKEEEKRRCDRIVNNDWISFDQSGSPFKISSLLSTSIDRGIDIDRIGVEKSMLAPREKM